VLHAGKAMVLLPATGPAGLKYRIYACRAATARLFLLAAKLVQVLRQCVISAYIFGGIGQFKYYGKTVCQKKI
jgi:hypothetical protein